jgi:hypothetical protein
VTNAVLVRVLARALRAAADELERASATDTRQPSTRPVEPPASEPDEVSRARASVALRRLGGQARRGDADGGPRPGRSGLIPHPFASLRTIDIRRVDCVLTWCDGRVRFGT